MRTIFLTEEQFQQLLAILEQAKVDADAWAYEYATTTKQYKETEEYGKEIDAVIALFQNAVIKEDVDEKTWKFEFHIPMEPQPPNTEPPTPHTEE